MESQRKTDSASMALQDTSSDWLKLMDRRVRNIKVEQVEEENCPDVATGASSPSQCGELGTCQGSIESQSQSKSDSLHGATLDQLELMDHRVVYVKEEPTDEDNWPDIAVDVGTSSLSQGGAPRTCQGGVESENRSQEQQIDLESGEQGAVLIAEGSRESIANVSVKREFNDNEVNMASQQSASQEEDTGWMIVEIKMEGDSPDEDTGWISQDITSGCRESLSFDQDQCPYSESQRVIQNVQDDHSNVLVKEEKEDDMQDKTGQQKGNNHYLQSDDDIPPYIKLGQTDIGLRTVVGKKLDLGRIICDGPQDAIIDADEHQRKQNEMDCEATGGDQVTQNLDQSDLEEHMDIQSEGILASSTSSHTSERPHHACNFCSKSFSHKGHLNKHMRVHTGERPYQCHMCPKAFTQKCSLTEHLRTHTDERPYACKLCSRAFKQSQHVISHMKTHDNGDTPHACNLCSAAFKHRGQLKEHLELHTGERPHACNLCSKAFKKKSNRDIHMRTHTGERPHSCIVCMRTFSHGNSLTRHMRTHTGERPYSCNLCIQSFTYKSALTTHMKAHTDEFSQI